MKTIYLVRHGLSETGKNICLGQKDVRLSHEGEKQAQRLARYFDGKALSGIFTSPLVRCEETARIVAKHSGHGELARVSIKDFLEVDTGLWDGLTFDEIRERWPREYEERGTSPGRTAMPQGESLLMAGERFLKALDPIVRETFSDSDEADSLKESKKQEQDDAILITTHAGVIRSFLSLLTGTDIDRLMEINVPYASVTILRGTSGKKSAKEGEAPENLKSLGGFLWEVQTVGLRPVESISLSEVDRMWKECGVTPELRAHMEAVADTAMNLIGYDPSAAQADWFDPAFSFSGSILNTRILYYSALLHDLRRADGGRIHAESGAAYLTKQGYQELAIPVKLHHDPKVSRPGEPLSEAEVLYYADKLVQGSRLVSLEERFQKSREKCHTPEAEKAHKERYLAALSIQRKVTGQTKT